MIKLPQDPVMLLSVLNMKLRDQYNSLEVCCEDLNVSQQEIEAKLKQIDYEYCKENNQFI